VLEQSDFDRFADDPGAAKVLADLEEGVNLGQGLSHVVGINGEVLAVEGVEDGFIVRKDFASLRNTTILVDDDAIAAICALAHLVELLEDDMLVLSCARDSTLSRARTYHELQNTGGEVLRG
jgi:hypothetical protein